MRFDITLKAKNKARTIRICKERKWLSLRITYYVSFIISVISLLCALFIIPYDSYEASDWAVIIFSVTLVLGVIARTFTINLTRHWIHSRVNERMWAENRILYQSFQVPLGAGLNARSVDNTGYLFEMNLDTVKNVMYNDKTRRVEFYVQGKGYHLSNYYKGEIDNSWELKEGYKCTLYDYYSPSIIEYFSSEGIPIITRTLNDFDMFDNKI